MAIWELLDKVLNENLIVDLVRRKVVTDTFRRLQHEKKELIYRTAIRLFGDYGYDGLPVERFCKEASISKGSFFQYFPSKTHLLEFTLLVFDDYLAIVVDEIRANETAVFVRDRLRYLYESLVVNVKLFRSEQKFYLFAAHALSHAGVVIEGIDLERHFRDYIDDIVRRGTEIGEVRADVDVELTGYLVSVILESLLQRQFGGVRMPLRQTEDYLISFLFDGIKA